MSMISATLDRLIDSDHGGSAAMAEEAKNSSSKKNKQVSEEPDLRKAAPLYRYHSDAAAVVHRLPSAMGPRSPSPSSSPYVVTFKGRRGGGRSSSASAASSSGKDCSVAAAAAADDVPAAAQSSFKFRDPGPSEQQTTFPCEELSSSLAAGEELSSDLSAGLSSSSSSKKSPARNGLYEDDGMGKFLNDKQSVGAAEKQQRLLNPALSSPGGLRKPSFSSSSSGYGEEFYDAFESPFEDSSSQAGDSSEQETGEPEVASSARPQLNEAEQHQQLEQQQQQEIVELKHNKAEEVLEMVLQKLAAGGIAVPQAREKVDELDIAEQLYIKRFVETAVARGAARAEVQQKVEEELAKKESEIRHKSREVTRLQDKVRYNELVNKEMTQRNQEAVEIARKRRRARQRVTRIALTGVCAAVAVGVTAALVYKYAPPSLRAFRRPSVDAGSDAAAAATKKR